MKKSITPTNIVWVDNLRGVSAAAIVLLHVSAQMSRNYGKISETEWWVSNLYINLSRFGVPIFIMMTGVLTLGKRYTLRNFITKKFSRLLIPFLFWSFVYILYDLIRIYLKHPETINFQYSIGYISKKMVLGASYQMWYVYMLIIIYLIHPIINKCIIYSTTKEQMYFIFACFLSFLVSYYLKTFKFANFIRLLSEFTGYMVLGYYLSRRNYKKNIKFYIFICITLYIVSYLIICFYTFHSSIVNNKYTEQFKPWDFLQAVSVFLLFLLVPAFNKKNKILSIISKYSYGIYLIHVLIINLLAKAGVTSYTFNSFFSIPIISICTMIISILILYTIDRLPLGKYIVK